MHRHQPHSFHVVLLRGVLLPVAKLVKRKEKLTQERLGAYCLAGGSFILCCVVVWARLVVEGSSERSIG